MILRMVNRILPLLTGLLAAWQVAVGINDAEALPMVAYSVGFGVLLIASLLLLILGLDVLESPAVVVASTVIPLSLSLGLVWELLPALRVAYLAFSICGLLAVAITRLTKIKNKVPIYIIAIVHGIAGLIIFILPILWAILGKTNFGFALVGVGGALIGIGGLLLSFLKTGKPILSRNVILSVLPGLLFFMTAAFVAGFSMG